MDRTRLIVVMLIALLAIFIPTSQAQPVAVLTELAVDSSPPMIAIETDCLLLKAKAITIEKVLTIKENSLFNLQTQNTLFKIKTSPRTLQSLHGGLFAVNIGFQRDNQSTINISAPIS